MPGITGVIAKRIIGDELGKLETMLDVMKHESFYTSGTFCNSEMGVCLGHVAIEGSFSDCMPIYNEKANLVLFLAGECFVDKDITASLLSYGHRFNPENASFLIHLFEEQDLEFFSNLNGWFSGVIVDLGRRQVFLFNDRYSKRKIYFHENDQAFYFSSEAKSLLKLFPSLRSINPWSLGQYMTYDCVLDNRTLFSSICMLPPGSVWRFANGDVEKRVHYDQCRLESQTRLPDNQFYAKLEETFVRILPRYLGGKAKMLALTGGLDTRMMMACIDPQPGQLPCYSHGGVYNDFLDVRIARKVAKACNQEYHVIRVGEEFLSDFPAQVEKAIYVTDGLANVCQAYQIFTNKEARKIAPIRLTGKFGSQVLKHISGFHRPGGYDADEQLIHPDFRQYIQAGKETFSELTKGHPLSLVAFKEIPWWWGGNSTAEFSQLTVRSPYLDNDFVDLLYQSPLERIDFVKFQMGVIKRRNPRLHSIMTDMGFGGSSSPFIAVPQRLLYRLIGFAGKGYERDKLPYSLQHWVARVDHFLLSPLRINRLLMGLGDYRHFRIWFRDELSHYVKAILLDTRTLNRAYWNRGFLERAVDDHVKGRMNRLPEIRKALTVELIERVLIQDI